MSAGYSGTPLPKKLGIKPGHVVGGFKASEGLPETLGGLPIGARLLLDPRASRTLEAGLVDNKVCAVNADWSALRFVVRLQDR